MIRKIFLKTRYSIFAGLMAAMVGLSGGLEAQAQGPRYDRDRYGDGWTWYNGDYRPNHDRGYYRDYDRRDRYYRSNYRGNYYRGYNYGTRRFNYYDGYRGGGVRVGPVRVRW